RRGRSSGSGDRSAHPDASRRPLCRRHTAAVARRLQPERHDAVRPDQQLRIRSGARPLHPGEPTYRLGTYLPPRLLDSVERHVVIIGAGPAGLTAAYVLSKRDVPCTVLEADSVVGGISRTATADGWRFDIGGHRFFTKVQPVEDLWFEILGADDF